MDTILRLLLSKLILVYLDDIIVMAATFEEHLRLVRKLFTLLGNAGLTVKLDTCKFLRKEIKYLGVKITQDGIKTDSERTEAITSMSPLLKIVSKLLNS